MNRPLQQQEDSSKDTQVVWLLFQNDTIILNSDTQVPPSFSNTLAYPVLSEIYSLGIYNGKPHNTVCIASEAILEDAHYAVNLLEYLADAPHEMFALISKSYQLGQWDRQHKFCGSCGKTLVVKEGELAKQCTACNGVKYPAAFPAIMVAITKGDSILLVRTGDYSNYNGHSHVAGYLDQGETLEECVVREVKEETGLSITNVVYSASQPFCLSNTIMIGFTAEWESGEPVHDGVEICESGWYTKETIPENVPPGFTLAGTLIKSLLNA